jgi:hypothetical protein
MAVSHEVRVKRNAINIAKEIETKLENRQAANKQILKIIEELVDNNSQLRFCQILTILGLDDDRFMEESVDTLEAIKNKVAEL